MWKSFEDKKKEAVPVKVITMTQYVNMAIKRVILARKEIPNHIDMTTTMHAGIKRPVW